MLPSESPGFTTQDKDQNQFDTVDSDVDSSGVTMPVILGPDQELLNIDAGLLAASSGGSGA